jgi:membrane protein
MAATRKDGVIVSGLAALAVAGVLASRLRRGTLEAPRRFSPATVDAPSAEGAKHAARSPTEFSWHALKDVATRTWSEVNKDRLLSVAAGVTFYALLAIFPAIGALVSLYGLVADAATINDHLGGLAGILPGSSLDIIREQVTRLAAQSNNTLGFGLIFGIAVSLWSANAGVKAIFDALNVAYEEDEKRGFFALTLQSLLFTLAAVIGAIAVFSAVVVLPIALNFVGLGRFTETLVSLARWPALLCLVLLALAVLYRYGPSRQRARWRWVTPGSVVATILWILVSVLFSWYVANFADYNKTYGSLGAAIGLMTWLWLSTAIVLLGAEINAELEHQTADDSTTGPERPLGERGARMADTVAGTR